MKSKFGAEFNVEYKKLNKAQKEAVDSIDGPVMVVAGPGTGKTQILALRIGSILLQTDTKPDGILCLTFTNSAVRAMREKLFKYIGPEASLVKISTFHSFGMEMLEKYYSVLGLDRGPELMDEKDIIILCDKILHNNNWEYIRPRTDASRYFGDLKSLISLLKRERVTPKDFENEIRSEIKSIESDPASISSRGESKEEFKKDIQKNIKGLSRSLEAVKFYSLYEAEKKERNLFDYDDILESLNLIVEESIEAKNYIKENFLYVLIDEHQDSSGVQNAFLKKVWGGVEKADIFVVGDDRQLIYGFGGASLQYFENFRNMFGKAKLITLIENYRSTKNILNLAHDLLESAITKGKLKSHHKENHSLRLVEAYYPRDEIISCALEIKDKIRKVEGSERRTNINPDEIAILVPKNRQVRSTVAILKDLGISVSGSETINFFEVPEAISFLQVLKILANPNDSVALTASFFDKLSGISPLKAHEFLKNNNMRDFSLLNVVEDRDTLFESNGKNKNEVNIWLQKLKSWLLYSSESLYPFIQKVGTEFLLDTAQNHQNLVLRIEILRTLLHLILGQMEKNSKLNLIDFLNFLDRVEMYGENIPLAVFGADQGVKVLTLHGSKGLEFDYVWIAHMDERSFSGAKIGGFSLPSSIKEKVENRDEEVLKRQLYVALTRAKRFCTISYAIKSYTGNEQELASILLPFKDSFEQQDASETEKIILKDNKRAYVEAKHPKRQNTKLNELVKLVAKDYEDRKVSVSLLNNFFECPWKWYFRNLLQLPEPKSESLEFGNIVHDSIDVVLKLSKKPNTKDLQNTILHQIENSGFGDERKQQELNKLVFSVVSKWVDKRLDEIKKKRETERSVPLHDNRFPHLSIYGKIDLIEHLDSKNMRVTDFKTGSVRKKSDIEKLDEEGRLSNLARQLAMYSYLLESSPKWKNVSVRESRLEFLEAKDPKESIYDHVVSEKEKELVVRDIKDYDELVKSGQWLARECHYNSYGKNTECAYCKMAKIYK